MAKLYWRIKKNGKWTWRACSKQFMDKIEPVLDLYVDKVVIDDSYYLEEAVE